MDQGPPRRPVLLAVAAGGAAGGALRAGLDRWEAGPGAFPWVTLLVNVTGSAALAALPALPALRRHPLLPPALGSGVLGGYTTLSAYSEQTRALLASGRLPLAAAYVLVTLVACLAVVALVSRRVPSAEGSAAANEEGDR